jgi:magnesium transporter
MATNVLEKALQQPSMEASKEIVNQLNTFELARSLTRLDYKNQAIVFRLLDKDKAIEVFEFLTHDQRADLIEAMEDPSVAELVENLDPDDRVRLFEELPAKVAKRLIADISPEARKSVNTLLGYPEKSVGRIMSPRYLAVRNYTKVSEALEAIRLSELRAKEIEIVFVIDSERFYQGYIWLATLVRAHPERPVEELLGNNGVAVGTHDNEMQAVDILKGYDLPAIPTVDREGRLVGAVTFDDVIDLMEEEATDTAFAQAGVRDLHGQDKLRSQRMVKGSIRYAVQVRLIFLVITLIGGLIVGGVIEQFEETLEAVVAAAIFIPLVMDMGGNVGTQSSTIFARGLAWRDIDANRFLPYFLREITVGAIMAAILGTAAGVIAYLWQGQPQGVPELGLAVGLALFGAVLLGAMLGAFLPWLLLKLGFDQATAADPFITTIKDFVSLLLYFMLVNWLIGVA